ncbi:MAG: DUF3500 domain-containing protein [Rhodospirillaceae bacterium]|nr:DUF3500 domain-containing protein [Rhodospirillaceae bacterium]
MTKKMILSLSALLLVSTAGSAQEAFPGANPLDGIDVHVSEEMVRAAQAILESTRDGVAQQGDRDARTNRVERMVGYSREALLSLPAEDEAKRDWVYWPRFRVGLTLEYMTAEQRMLVHDFLQTSLSAIGYLKTVHVMQTEEILNLWEDVGLPRGNEKYWLVFFGTPSMDAPWAWRFEGHHVSLNVSVAPGSIRVTPTFFGADPAEVPQGPMAGFRPHAAVEDLGRTLISSMSGSQREVAILSDQPPREIFATNLGRPRDDWDAWKQTLQPEGIAVADLGPEQRHMVQRLLDEVVTTYRPEISQAYLRTIDVDDLSFAWMGSMQRREPHYYRLQGADFVFEYDNVQDDANHVHTVWRSKSGDFGDNLLPDHYQSAHR